jgi:hypothetical protein
MNIDFVVPAVAFALAALVLGWLLVPPDGAPSELSRAARIVVPSVLVAGLSWLVWRFIAIQIGGSGISLPHLVNGGKGATSGGSPAPWQGVVYFVTMVAGMAAHTTWQFLPQSQRAKPVAFDKWQYVRPALVAPMIFLAVWKIVGVQPFGIESILLSFQNGFFWQTVMSKRS